MRKQWDQVRMSFSQTSKNQWGRYTTENYSIILCEYVNSKNYEGLLGHLIFSDKCTFHMSGKVKFECMDIGKWKHSQTRATFMTVWELMLILKIMFNKEVQFFSKMVHLHTFMQMCNNQFPGQCAQLAEDDQLYCFLVHHT